MTERNCWLVVTTRILGRMGIMLMMCGMLALAAGQANEDGGQARAAGFALQGKKDLGDSQGRGDIYVVSDCAIRLYGGGGFFLTPHASPLTGRQA